MLMFLKLLRNCLLTLALLPGVAYCATDLNIDIANDYMRQVRKELADKNSDTVYLKTALEKVEDLSDRAKTCIDSANSQLQSISDLEKDIGLTEQLSDNSEDAVYIRNKKQLQTAKVSQCRLVLFKTQDLALDLKEVIKDDLQSTMLTVSEPMWQAISSKQSSSSDLMNLSIIALVTISIIWALWLVPNLRFIRNLSANWPRQIFSVYRVLLAATTIVIVTLELIGYRQLAVYLSQGALLTVGLLIAFVVIVYAGNSAFVQEKILKTVLITKKHKVLELRLLKFSVYALIATWFVLLLLEWWGVPLGIVDKIKALLLSGETVYGIKIIPMRLLIGIFVFSIIQIVGKYLAVYVSRQNKFEGETETQVVIGSLITYVVFSIALVCALLVSGVDFTGLAIVAGALSVGIGLGLQNVVNNFVSGLILLIEKPVKPGDRIMIKGIEGFVKKISIRSTHIITLLKEDVIIPNSDLIANPITNYVFHDTLYKLGCRVGVAYDSDIDKVRQTLLNVALKHRDIAKDPINQPTVVLKEFCDSSLAFELLCVVSDVNQKYSIASEINMMIVKAFREEGIVMAFPQLDVHVHEVKAS